MGFGRYRFRRSFGQVRSQFRGARPDTYPLRPENIDVSGAGDPDVNGNYEIGIGDINGKDFWTGPGSNPTDLFVIMWDGSRWIIAEAFYVTSDLDEVLSDSNFVFDVPEPYDALYFGWGTGNAPEDGQGSVGSGTPPAPTIQGL